MTRTHPSRLRQPSFWWGILTLTALLAAVVCAIVNLAVESTLSWAWIVIASLALACGLLAPLLLLKGRRLTGALTVLTALIMPLLLVIERFSPVQGWAWPVGLPIAAAALAVLWLAAWLLTRPRLRRWYALGLVALTTLPLNWVINGVVDRYTQMTSPQNIINVISVLALAAACFVIGSMRRRTAA